MDESDISTMANLLYTSLVSASPKKTHNMASNITMEDLGDRYLITVSKATNDKGVNYARYVNYNWGSRSKRSKANYNKRGLHKERENYKWVERTIEHVLSANYGKGSVVNEL